MKTKPNILESNLFKPGIKFIATDDIKDTTLPPSSIGFFSFFKNPDRDYQNVIYAVVTIVRRGKTGQQRVERREISLPIFTDKRMLEHDDYLPLGRRFYIHIKEEPFSNKNLMEIDTLEFLGWSYTYSRYLKHIVNNFVYPNKKANWGGEVICREWTNIGRVPEHFAESAEETARVYATKEFRRNFILAARALESKLTKCICSYKKSVIGSILNSSHFLDYTNKNYYEVVNKELVKDTVSFYKEKYKRIESLVEKNKVVIKKRKGS